MSAKSQNPGEDKDKNPEMTKKKKRKNDHDDLDKAWAGIVDQLIDIDKNVDTTLGTNPSFPKPEENYGRNWEASPEEEQDIQALIAENAKKPLSDNLAVNLSWFTVISCLVFWFVGYLFLDSFPWYLALPSLVVFALAVVTLVRAIPNERNQDDNGAVL